jgi:alanine dehydrogenase
MARLRYLSAADVRTAMPDVEERLQLARRAMVALNGGSQLPAKIGVRPRPDASFGHAMPAWFDGDSAHGTADLLGMKWVVGFPTNAAAGLSAIHGTVLLNDATTGVPRAILDATVITAQRTAAVTGVAIQAFAPGHAGSRPRIALVGAGVQAHSHLPVLAHQLPGSDLVVSSLHAERAGAAASAAAASGGFASVAVAADAASAIEGADVVVTTISFGTPRQILPASAFARATLVVAVDYDMCVPATVAREAHRFVVDERGQFLAGRASGIFSGYPDPVATLGDVLTGSEGPNGGAGGRTVVTHLGVGLADVVFGDAILRRAEALGIGIQLDA